MKKTVYLAGPILDCTNREANDWRMEFCHMLDDYGIVGISPLRCEPLYSERYGVNSTDPLFGTAKAIAAKNFMDVSSCDLTLCYMPKAINDRRISLGTLLELGWAHALRKPTILVTDDPLLSEHPVVQACAGWILPALSDATDLLIGLYSDYID